MSDLPKIKPLSESAVVVEFGDEISEELNANAIALADLLERDRFLGFIEAVPAYASVTVFCDAAKAAERSDHSTAARFVEAVLGGAFDKLSVKTSSTRDVVEIPTDFSSPVGLDLETVANTCRLKVDDVIDIFISRTYRVYMVGFLPGFAYMGETDERIRVPRLEKPRAKVPKGSVGLAGAQTGIYPLESPGGWQIIGRTSIEMFTPDAETPSRLKAGDIVKFIPISCL
jgi:inhibitor of KinA